MLGVHLVVIDRRADSEQAVRKLLEGQSDIVFHRFESVQDVGGFQPTVALLAPALLTDFRESFPEVPALVWAQGGDREALYEQGAVDIVGQRCGPTEFVRKIRYHSEGYLRLKEVQDGANELRMTKAQFLTNMSHEIRTPLNGIIGMAQLVLSQELEDEQRRRLGIIHSSGSALLTVLDDVLDFARMESGELELESTELDLVEVVDGVAKIVGELAKEKGLELSYHVSASLPQTFLGDPGRLRQALLNLASNAARFTDSGFVEIIVSGEPQDDDWYELSFQVSDSGVGIAPERQAKLFQSFSQVDASNTRRHGGMGLGLATVARLSQLMDGQANLSSVPGQGSTFTFTARLPAAQPPGELDPLPTVTVVAEQEHRRAFLSRQLQDLGCRLVEDEADVWLVDQPVGHPEVQIVHRSGSRDTRLVVLGEGPCHEGTVLAKPVDQKELVAALLARDSNGTPPSLPAVPSEKVRLLLAEDNLVNQIVAGEMLETLGYDVHIVNNGKEALEAATEGDYDIVLMDCHMPEMDGYEATRQIRDRHPGLPIVALTADAMKGTRERCLEAGMNEYVSKPFKMEQLRELISQLLAERR